MPARMRFFPLLAVLAHACLACAVSPPTPATSGGASSDDSGYGSPLPTDDGDPPGDVAPQASSSLDATLALPSGDDASSPPPFDANAPVPAAPEGACPSPPSAGDLVIDELMIESVAGTGDYGEWLEVESTRPCALDLRGLHGEAPSGLKVRTFDVVEDFWLAPSGTFVVADSYDPAINHDLPGAVIAWAGEPGDVLRNKGGTVSLLLQGALIDSLTFPALKLVVGASTSFPADCPLSMRSDWTAWQTSTASWFPGFYGTPNAPNDDVSCP
jgi:hypothetical protein